MLATVSPVLTPAVLIPLGGLLLGGLLLLIVRALGVLAAAGAGLDRRRRAGLGAAALLLLALPWLSPPGGSALLAARDLAAAPAAEPPAAITDPPLPGAPDLGGADFYVIFLESYGVAAFEDPGRRPALEAAAERWAEDARAGGFDYRSAQVQSPTFGGGSWRAHASLLSGAWVEREALYRALIESAPGQPRPSLWSGGIPHRRLRTGNPGRVAGGRLVRLRPHLRPRGDRLPGTRDGLVGGPRPVHALRAPPAGDPHRHPAAVREGLPDHEPHPLLAGAAVRHPLEPLRRGDRLRRAPSLDCPRRLPGPGRTVRALRNEPGVPVPHGRRLPARVRTAPGVGRRHRRSPAAEALAPRLRHLGDAHASLCAGPGVAATLGRTRLHPHPRSRGGHLVADERFPPRSHAVFPCPDRRGEAP